MPLQSFRTEETENKGESKAEEQAKNQAYENEGELREVEQEVNGRKELNREIVVCLSVVWSGKYEELHISLTKQLTKMHCNRFYLRPRNGFSVEN